MIRSPASNPIGQKRLSDLLSKFVMSSHDPAHSVNFLLISHSLVYASSLHSSLLGQNETPLSIDSSRIWTWTPARDEVSTYKLIQHARTNFYFQFWRQIPSKSFPSAVLTVFHDGVSRHRIGNAKPSRCCFQGYPKRDLLLTINVAYYSMRSLVQLVKEQPLS